MPNFRDLPRDQVAEYGHRGGTARWKRIGGLERAVYAFKLHRSRQGLPLAPASAEELVRYGYRLGYNSRAGWELH